MKFYVVQGPMGVGKTTIVSHAVWDAAQQVGGGWIPCYISMVDILNITTIHDKVDHLDLLAAALLIAFSGLLIFSLHYSLKRILEQIRKDFNVPNDQVVKIVLHVDEFQKNPVICNILLKGARATMRNRYGILVVAIPSGIYDFGDITPVIEPSEGQTDTLSFGALPHDKLESKFIDALQISSSNYEKNPALKTMLQDCGDLAYLVVELIGAVKQYGNAWQKLRNGVQLNLSECRSIFQACTHSIRTVYGEKRFHSIFSPETKCDTDEQAAKRESFKLKTLPAMKKMVLLALSRRPVYQQEKIVDEMTVRRLLEVGTFRLEEVTSDSSYVQMPLMALVVMDEICEALPREANLSDPFEDTWQTLERLAMCTLLTQVASREVDSWVDLQKLRPGALFQGLEKLQVCIPLTCTFTTLLTYTNSESILDDRSHPIQVEQIADFRLCASNQPGIDGWVNLRARIGGKEEILIWLSQSKKQDISGLTGQASGSRLYNSQIERGILSKMQRVVDDLKARYPSLEDAYVMYDVFSDRLDPEDVNCTYSSLQDNEGICITRNDSLDSVLAGFVARKRTITN